MIRRIVNWLVLLPVALAVVALAVANRGPVLLSADPLSRDNPAIAITLPLYAVIFAAIILGVLLGGGAVWFKQGLYRKRARKAEAEREAARAEVDRLRAELAKNGPPVASATGLPIVFDRTAA